MRFELWDNDLGSFLSRDAMRKRALCCRPVSVRLSVYHVHVLYADGWRYRQTSSSARWPQAPMSNSKGNHAIAFTQMHRAVCQRRLIEFLVVPDMGFYNLRNNYLRAVGRKVLWSSACVCVSVRTQWRPARRFVSRPSDTVFYILKFAHHCRAYYSISDDPVKIVSLHQFCRLYRSPAITQYNVAFSSRSLYSAPHVYAQLSRAYIRQRYPSWRSVFVCCRAAVTWLCERPVLLGT